MHSVSPAIASLSSTTSAENAAQQRARQPHRIQATPVMQTEEERNKLFRKAFQKRRKALEQSKHDRVEDQIHRHMLQRQHAQRHRDIARASNMSSSAFLSTVNAMSDVSDEFPGLIGNSEAKRRNQQQAPHVRGAQKAEKALLRTIEAKEKEQRVLARENPRVKPQLSRENTRKRREEQARRLTEKRQAKASAKVLIENMQEEGPWVGLRPSQYGGIRWVGKKNRNRVVPHQSVQVARSAPKTMTPLERRKREREALLRPKLPAPHQHNVLTPMQNIETYRQIMQESQEQNQRHKQLEQQQKIQQQQQQRKLRQQQHHPGHSLSRLSSNKTSPPASFSSASFVHHSSPSRTLAMLTIPEDAKQNKLHSQSQS